MAEEQTEGMTPEEEAPEQAADAPAAEPAEEPQAPVPEESQAQEEAKKKEEEEKKKERRRRRGKLLTRFLLLLVLLLLFFEAALFFLWWRYDTIMEEQAEQAAQMPVQRRVTNSAYANWSGVYRPSDWPAPADAFAVIPEYEGMWSDEEEPLAPAEEPDPGE